MNSETAVKLEGEEREPAVNRLRFHEDHWIAVTSRERRTKGTPAID